jgi:hypothetical protein
MRKDFDISNPNHGDEAIRDFAYGQALDDQSSANNGAFYMGLISNKKAKKACDDAWSELVKKRAKYRCEVCGKTTALNSHHIYSRSNNSTRHDPENGVCCCAGCHVFSSSFSFHKTPADAMDWLEQKRGVQWLKDLRQRAKMPLYKVDYALELIYLQQEIAKL